MLRTWIWISIVLVAVSGRSWAQPSHVLSIDELNFSIEAPDSTWVWTELPVEGATHRNFICEHQETGQRMMMMVFTGRHEGYDDKEMEDFVAGVASSWTKRGFKVDESFFTPAGSTLAFPNAHRFGYRLTSPQEEVLYGFGYTVTEGRLFAFQGFSDVAEEPAELTSLVQSLTILDPTREVPALENPPTWLGQMLMVGYFLLLGLGGFVGWTVNRISGRPRFNGWLLGIGLITAVALALAVYFVPKIPGSMEPYQRGELFGSIIAGPALMPALLGVYLSRRFAKRVIAT